MSRWRHIKAKREAGLCAYGGCREVSGDDYRCAEHKAAHNAAEKQRAKEGRQCIKVNVSAA